MATPTISATSSPKSQQSHQSLTSSKTEQRTISAAATSLEQSQSAVSLNRHRVSSPASSSNVLRRTQDCARIITFQVINPPSPIELSSFYTIDAIPRDEESNNPTIKIMHDRLISCYVTSDELLRAFPTEASINLENSDYRPISSFQIGIINDKIERIKRVLKESKMRLTTWEENQELTFRTIKNDVCLTMDYSKVTSLIQALDKFLKNAQKYQQAILDYNSIQSGNLGRRAPPFTHPEISGSQSSITFEHATDFSPQTPDDSDLERKVPDKVDNTIQLTDDQKNEIKSKINRYFKVISSKSKRNDFPRKLCEILTEDEFTKLTDEQVPFWCIPVFKKGESFSIEIGIRAPSSFCRMRNIHRNLFTKCLNDALELLALYPSPNPTQRALLTDYLESFTSYTKHYISLVDDIKIPNLLSTMESYSNQTSKETDIFPKNPNAENTFQYLNAALTSATKVQQAFPVNLASKSPLEKAQKAASISIKSVPDTDPILFQFFQQKKDITDLSDEEITTVNDHLKELEEILKKLKNDKNLEKWSEKFYQKFYFNINDRNRSMTHKQAKMLFENLQEFHKQATSYWESILVVRRPDPLITNGIDLEELN